MSIKYIADIGRQTTYPPERALADATVDRGYNIYILSVENHPTSATYWSDWGGIYDNPTTENISLFFGLFLVQVATKAALLVTSKAFFVESDVVYINILNKPWQYLSTVTEFLISIFFSSSVADESDQSNTMIKDGSGSDIPYQVRLNIPSLPSKLSDPVTGSTILGAFSISLQNNDGEFDDIEETNFLNVPIKIRRSDVAIPDLTDFDVIRLGLVESLKVSSSLMTVKGADFFRTFKESVTRKFTLTDFPSAPSSTIGKDIPIGYGAVLRVPLFEVDTNDYIALDTEYITSVQAVYDKDGVSIGFSLASGIITATGGKTADVTGLSNNRIGEIITSEIESKANIAYLDGEWDKTESDLYVNSSARIGLYIKSGTVRKLIEEALKSDSAFFVTKNDGRLTLRQWGQTYATHNIDNWRIMEIPSKDNQESVKFYNSTVSVKYGKRESGNIYDFEVVNESRELELLEKYRKSKPETYSTRLLNSTDSDSLASLMLDRFGDISEIISIKLGINTVAINLLDKVNLTVKINERTFSRFTEWIVREVNPAQDSLVLESI